MPSPPYHQQIFVRIPTKSPKPFRRGVSWSACNNSCCIVVPCTTTVHKLSYSEVNFKAGLGRRRHRRSRSFLGGDIFNDRAMSFPDCDGPGRQCIHSGKNTSECCWSPTMKIPLTRHRSRTIQRRVNPTARHTGVHPARALPT